MEKKRWTCIEIACAGDVADDLAAEIVEEFASGVEITEAGIRFYLEGDHLSGEQAWRIQQVLSRVEKVFHPTEDMTVATAPLLDDDWANRWKIHFKPFRVGRRFIICPTWEEAAAEPGDLLIRMDPGMAFGTGHHETTRLCLERMEEWSLNSPYSDPGSCSLLDLGTGSGVLALAAALLGIGRVFGVDNDPEALDVARENVALNGFEDVITLQEGTVDTVADVFDIVVANIQSMPLIRMAPELCPRVKPSGWLMLSGILLEQEEDVRAAYEEQGMNMTKKDIAGEWCLLAFQPRPGERAKTDGEIGNDGIMDKDREGF